MCTGGDGSVQANGPIWIPVQKYHRANPHGLHLVRSAPPRHRSVEQESQEFAESSECSSQIAEVEFIKMLKKLPKIKTKYVPKKKKISFYQYMDMKFWGFSK